MAVAGTGGGGGSKRRKPKARQSQQARSQQAAYGSQGRAVQRAATQQHARQQTQRAARQPVARPPRTARPLAAAPPANVRAGKPVTDAKQRRAVAVTAYNQLSGAGKRGHLAGAQKRVQQGKASETDVAILHAHSTRVQGNRKRVAATRAFNAIAGDPQKIRTLKQVAASVPDNPTNALSTGSGRGLNLKPGHTYGPARKDGSRPIRDPNGKEVGVVAPLKHPNVGSVANLPTAGKVVAALGPAATKGLNMTPLPRVIKNIPKDLAENVVTSPTSIAKFAVDAAKNPKDVGKALAKPYEDLAKHPGKFVSEHPVTSALMLQPAARAPGLVAGRALRSAGKQTLARESATLENTALRQARRKSRGAVRNVTQTRADKRAITAGHKPAVTAREIDRRVDESYAGAQKHSERVRESILSEAKKEAAKHPKAERPALVAAADENVGKAIVASKRRQYAQEFGATPRVENGRVIEQPNATQAHLHDNLADAHIVKDHLNAKAQTIKRGTGSVFEGGLGSKLYGKENMPVEYTVRDAGHGKFAVMPKQVADRLNLHGRIGKEKAVPAVILRQTRRGLTRAVLPYHPTWLSGQGIEGGIRSAVAGAGPTSWMRANRLQARHPDLYKGLAERAVPGGLIGRTVAHEMADRTLQQEIPDSLVARKFTELGKTPGLKQVRGLNDAATKFIFDRVNGQFLEGVPQKAMLGRALKRSPLMDRQAFGLTNKAIDKLARGLEAKPEEIVAASREVERMYGKYAGHSPRLRSLIMHWTPFIPWWINSARYLLQTLPRDHPFATALAADIGATEEQWRKEQGLSLRYRSDKSLPPWMLGGYPIQGGKNLLRVGHYTPGGSETDIAGGVSGLFLPQFAGTYGALRYGKDWKGDDLKHPDGSAYNQGERVLYGAAQLIESLVPGAAQAAQITGAPEILGGPSSKDKSTVKQRVAKQFRPISSVPIHRDTSGAGVEIPALELSPLQLQQVQIGG